MTFDDLSPSHEVPRDPVVLRQDAAITVQDALALAINENFPIGKSTIQRWAKTWSDQASVSPVKCVLVTTRTGASYQIDRDDFLSWLIEQKQNTRLGKVLQDPERPHETLKDPMRSRQTS